MSETGKQEERFKAGQVWHNAKMKQTRVIGSNGRTYCATSDHEVLEVNSAIFTTPANWRKCGYVLLPPETPDADRLDVLEGRVDALAAKVEALTAKMDALEGRVDALSAKVEALTAKMDALERPGETEPAPEPDVPRDCTGREVSCGQVVACGEALFEVTGDSLIPVCILPNDGWNYGQEASFIAADWAECRILWPLAERSEA